MFGIFFVTLHPKVVSFTSCLIRESEDLIGNQVRVLDSPAAVTSIIFCHMTATGIVVILMIPGRCGQKEEVRRPATETVPAYQRSWVRLYGGKDYSCRQSRCRYVFFMWTAMCACSVMGYIPPHISMRSLQADCGEGIP